MKLHILKGDHNGAKVLAFLKVLNLNCEVRYLNPHSYSKDPNFLNISPEGKSPVLQTTMDSFCETNTILRYLSRKHKEKGYGGIIPREEAKIDEWLEYCAREVDPVVKKVIYTKRNLAHFAKNEEELLEILEEVIRNIEGSLGNRSFLVGYTASLADLSIVTSFLYPFFSIYDEHFRDNHSTFNEYLEGVEEEFNLNALPKFFKDLDKIDPCHLVLKKGREETAEVSRLSTARPSRRYSAINGNGSKDKEGNLKLDNGDLSDFDEEEELDFRRFMIKTSKQLAKGVEKLNSRMDKMELNQGKEGKEPKKSPQFGTRVLIGDTSNNLARNESNKGIRSPFVKATEFPFDTSSMEATFKNMTESSSRTMLNQPKSKDPKLFMNQTASGFYSYKQRSPQVINSKNTLKSNHP